MRPGDNVLIYCGGQSKKSKLIIAKSVIKKIDRHNARDELPEEVEFVTGNAFEIIRLSETNIFETPVNFKEALPKLSFCPSNMGKWGVVLHGGARRISADDFGMLIPSR